MVSMPCSFEISKMILLSFQLGIEETMIDIGSIMMSTKHFFVSEERRKNIEAYLHYLIEYDRGHFNDYSLRQKLFKEWKDTFFEPFKREFDQKYKGKEKFEEESRVEELIEPQDLNAYTENLIETFCYLKPDEYELDWLFQRAIYASNMRDLLRINMMIRGRLKNAKITVKN